MATLSPDLSYSLALLPPLSPFLPYSLALSPPPPSLSVTFPLSVRDLFCRINLTECTGFEIDRVQRLLCSKLLRNEIFVLIKLFQAS